MTTIDIQNKGKRVQNVATITFLVLAVALSLIALWLIQGKGLAFSNNNTTVTESVNSGELLSASAALAIEKPVLFVFTPIQECEIQYCLTTDTVDKWLQESYPNRVNVVEVPVYSAHIYNNGTPPRLFADWDLIPDTPYSEWMPVSEMTEFGWGLDQTQVVYVSADRESYHHFDAGLDVIYLEQLLEE